MSVQEFSQEMSALDPSTRSTVHGNTVKVSFLADPDDYESQIESLKGQFGMVQVRSDTEMSGKRDVYSYEPQ